MSHPCGRLALIAACWALSLASVPARAADAQPVYRCGQTYQQAPCDQGKRVDVGDARNDAERRAAQAVARDEARLGTTMERERRAREKQSPPAPAVGIGAPAAAAPASAVAKAKREKKSKKAGKAATGSEDFIAIEPGHPRPKARRVKAEP
jgi:hypothetical protein